MITAFSIFLGAVVLGLLLSSIKRQQPKDVYVSGRKIDLVPLSMFSVEYITDVRRLSSVYYSDWLDGLLIRPLTGEFKPVFQSSRKEAIYDREEGHIHGEFCRS